jgi:hypothetical protein
MVDEGATDVKYSRMVLEEIAQVKSDELKSLEAYWRSKRHGDALPARRDIDPWEMRSFLPYVFQVAVTQNPLRFWLRVVGAGVVESYGEDVSSRYVDEIDLSDMQDEILDGYRAAALEARPIYSRCDYVKHDGRHVRYERLLLPLSSDGETVDMLLGGIVRLDKTD